eukprot:746491-Hanusia_phi.AAC.2
MGSGLSRASARSKIEEEVDRHDRRRRLSRKKREENVDHHMNIRVFNHEETKKQNQETVLQGRNPVKQHQTSPKHPPALLIPRSPSCPPSSSPDMQDRSPFPGYCRRSLLLGEEGDPRRSWPKRSSRPPVSFCNLGQRKKSTEDQFSGEEVILALLNSNK